jgi:hypothetical protein
MITRKVKSEIDELLAKVVREGRIRNCLARFEAAQVFDIPIEQYRLLEEQPTKVPLKMLTRVVEKFGRQQDFADALHEVNHLILKDFVKK